MSHLFDLNGKTALVTGATRGLGYHMARAMCEAGAAVFFNGRSEDELLARTEGLPNSHICIFDATNPKHIEMAMEQIGQIDILVNNIGARDRRDMDAFDLKDMRTLLESNLVAPFELSRIAARTMMPGSRIINVTSIAGDIARSGDAVYTATKAGLTGLTRAMAAELGPKGINVNAIAPGFFATEANKNLKDDPVIQSFVESRTSIQRWGEPEEIAGACVFLASQAASYITGQVITVDGGLSAHF